LQADVAEAIAQQIRLKLTPELARLRQTRPVDPEAFQDYFMAGNFARMANEHDGIRKAQIHGKKAIQKDPNFVTAHMALAGTYLVSFDGLHHGTRLNPPSNPCIEPWNWTKINATPTFSLVC